MLGYNPLLSATASVKSAIKYMYTLVDDRDSSASPTSGKYLKGTVELALPLGTAHFLKTEVDAQYHTTIGPKLFGQTGFVASVCGSMGIMYPLSVVLPISSTVPYKSHLSDRLVHQFSCLLLIALAFYLFYYYFS